MPRASPVLSRQIAFNVANNNGSQHETVHPMGGIRPGSHGRDGLASSALSQSPAAPSSTKDSSTPPGAKLEMSEASQHWLESANELGKAGLRINELADGARTQEQQGEVNLALMWALTAAVLAFSRMDPDYPEWIPILNSAMLGINNNHDNVYLITRIRGAKSARLLLTASDIRTIN